MEHLQDPQQFVGMRGTVEPRDDDSFTSEFEGVCIGVRRGFLKVRDANDDVFEVEASQFTPCPAKPKSKRPSKGKKTINTLVRRLAVQMLDYDDAVVSGDAYVYLRQLLEETGNEDIVNQVEATDNQFYLPENWRKRAEDLA